jgi:undecaprenyl-diphosphatase
LDFTLAHFCNRLGAGVIDPATLFLCDIWFLVVLWLGLGAAVVFLDRRRGRIVLATVVVALVVHFVISEGALKHGLFAMIGPRLRPWVAHPHEILPIGTRFADSSFPSSHNASSAAVCAVFGAYYKWSWPLGALFVVLMAFARVHNGMHYPSDVLGGVVLGLLYAWVAVRLLAKRAGEVPAASVASAVSRGE